MSTTSPWNAASSAAPHRRPLTLTGHAYDRLLERLRQNMTHQRALVLVAEALDKAIATGSLIPHAIVGQELLRLRHRDEEVFAVIKRAVEDHEKRVVVTVLTQMQVETLFGPAFARGERR